MGFRTFTFGDVRMALKGTHRGISDKTIQVTLSRMAKGGRVYSVTKGVFSLENRDEVVGFAFSPFYYGGLAALMIRDLIDDQVKMEVMTTRRVKRSFIGVYGGRSKVVLHHIPEKYYFGFTDTKYGDMTVPVSDPEKTLIDLFYYGERLPLQDYADLLKAISADRLETYLRRYDRRTRDNVIRFFKTYSPNARSGKLGNKY